jgi:hypothetical protein
MSAMAMFRQLTPRSAKADRTIRARPQGTAQMSTRRGDRYSRRVVGVARAVGVTLWLGTTVPADSRSRITDPQREHLMCLPRCVTSVWYTRPHVGHLMSIMPWASKKRANNILFWDIASRLAIIQRLERRPLSPSLRAIPWKAKAGQGRGRTDPSGRCQGHYTPCCCQTLVSRRRKPMGIANSMSSNWAMPRAAPIAARDRNTVKE